MLCRYLADIASEVIKSQGSYNLITASCQTFVEEFLKKLGVEPGSYIYLTWPKIGAASITGVGIAGVICVRYSGWIGSLFTGIGSRLGGTKVMSLVVPISLYIPHIAVGIGVTVGVGILLYTLLRDDENDDKSNEGDKLIQVVPL